MFTTLNHNLTGKSAALLAFSLTAGLSLLPTQNAQAHSRRPEPESTAQQIRRIHDALYCQAGDQKIIGQDAYEKMVNALADIVTDPITNRPNGSESQREAAFRGVSVIYSGVVFGGIALPVAGGAIGAGIGALAGALPGAGAGALIGGGAGIVVGTAEFITGLVLVSDLTLKVNERYPPETASLTSLAAGRYCASAKAGPWESLMVSLLKSSFNDRVEQLATSWENMSGLSAAQRKMLRDNRYFQPAFQHISQVRETNRIAANAPTAQPLSPWMQTVDRVLTAGGDSEQAWLEALGIGAMRAKVQNGQLRVTMPPALVAVGAAAHYQSNLPQLSFKVGGNGGALDPYFRCDTKIGDFDMQAGQPALIRTGPHAGTIRVAYTVAKGSTPGSTKLGLKWNGPEATLKAFAPTLTEDLSADLYFRVGADGLEFDSITLGNLSIRPNFPSDLPAQIPGISGLMDQMTKGIQQGLVTNIAGQGAWQEALGGTKTYSTRSLAKSLNASAGQYGLTEIQQVKSLKVTDGKLHATVTGQVLKMPAQTLTVAQVAQAYQKRSASGVALPSHPTRPNLPPVTRRTFEP